MTKKATKNAVSKRTTSPPFPAHPVWTTSKFFSFLRSGLRSKWMRWPPKFEVLARARRVYRGTNPRQRYEFQCAMCTEYFQQKLVEVDHRVPCGSLKCYDDIAGFVARLFVGVNDLRVVCKPCHRKITGGKI